jgi:hypothetical protein
LAWQRRACLAKWRGDSVSARRLRDKTGGGAFSPPVVWPFTAQEPQGLTAGPALPSCLLPTR